jgi:hypothetical protein
MLLHAFRGARTTSTAEVLPHESSSNGLELPERLVYCGEPEADLSFAWELQGIGASRGELGCGDKVTPRPGLIVSYGASKSKQCGDDRIPRI